LIDKKEVELINKLITVVRKTNSKMLVILGRRRV